MTEGMPSKTTATIVVIADYNSIEFRHSVNAVLRANNKLKLEVIVFDPDRLYSEQYTVGSQQLQVTHTKDRLAKLTANLFLIVPRRTLISQNWPTVVLEYCRKNPFTLCRPQYYTCWNEWEAPRVFEQSAAPVAIHSIEQPVTSGAVAVDRSTFLAALQHSKLDVVDELDLGLPWMRMTATILPNTSVFLYQEKLSLPKIYLSHPVFSFETIPTTHNSHPSKHKNISAPDWLFIEWKNLNRIDNRLFPSHHLRNQIVYKKIDSSLITSNILTSIKLSLHYDHYDYILFVPWLMKGGADRFAINYVNTIHELRPELTILVIATLPNDSSWSSQLSKGVDFCNFGSITGSLPESSQFKLLDLIISQFHPRGLHILNSRLGYDFINSISNRIKAKELSVAATSFSQEIDTEGRVLGYSHTHMPSIYNLTSIITTDNQAVVDMWVNEYGFDRNRIAVHHQPIATPKVLVRKIEDQTQLHVLWAARLAPEKQPAIVANIGRLLRNHPNITIDMYGEIDTHLNTSFLNSLPSNVRYKGAFDGPASLPIHKYNAYLYTSLFDGMPNAILEAAQYQLPIVSSAIGGIPEFITSYENGILIEDYTNASAYADALEKLAADPLLRERLALSATSRLKKDFSPLSYKSGVTAMLKKMRL